MEKEDMLEIVDIEGNVLQIVPRSRAHGDPSLMHRVVHVLVMNDQKDIFLQKRSMKKDVAPGRWDTSVGGHVDPGESIQEAAAREMQEELGVLCDFKYEYSYIHSNSYETEQVHTFSCVHNGPFTFNAEEIDEVRPWSVGEIKNSLSGDVLSDNFKHEFETFLKHTGR